MKKLSRKQRLRLYRLGIYRKNSDTKAGKGRLREKRLLMDLGSSVNIQAPAHFSLMPKDASLLVEFVEKLEKAAINPNTGRVCIDFSFTKQMFSDGTLYFWASWEHLKKCYPKKRFAIKKPSDVIVGQVLYQIGIAKFPGTDTNNFHKTVRDWCAASGCNVDASDAGNIFTNVQGKLASELTRSIYTGVTEAMTNCHHHAYEGLKMPTHLKKWWIFSREYEQSLQVVFCDLGIGIPRSLFQEGENVDESWFKKIKAWLLQEKQNGRIVNDALKIKAAIEIGRSRTKLGNRGKGLQQMVRILDEISNGQAFVEIISGSGVYRRRPRGRQSIETVLPLSNDKKTAIKGTMIHWSIPLSQKEGTR